MRHNEACYTSLDLSGVPMVVYDDDEVNVWFRSGIRTGNLMALGGG